MKKIAERLVLMFFGLLMALIISEIGLKIIFPYPDRTNTDSDYLMYKKHPLTGYVLGPDKEYIAFNDLMEFKIKVKINSWGLRDDDIDYSKIDKKVVLALGDSFTYAHEVEREQTYVEILQRKLSSTLKQDKEVVNAGVRGYGTAQEFLYYKELVNKGIKADLVLLWFATNDIFENQCIDSYLRTRKDIPCFQVEGNTLKLTYLPEFSHKSAGSKASARKVSIRNVFKKKEWLEFFKNSHLYRIIYMKLFHFSMNHPDIIAFIDFLGFHFEVPRLPMIISGWYTDQTSYGIRLTEKLIENFNKEVEKNGGQLVVVMLPHSLQYSKEKQKLLQLTSNNNKLVEKFLSDPVKPQRIVTTFCRENKIPIIDLLPGFARADKVPPLFFPYDGHLSPEGHILAADIVYKQLMENKSITGLLKGE